MTAADEQAPIGDRFCGRCGVSLQPLPVPHVARPCTECGRLRHLVEAGEDGQGIKVEAGDRFTIPAGFISMSLDPRKSRGWFARPGLTWFVRLVLTGDVPSSADELETLLERWANAADGVLEQSNRLTHLNLEDEKDGFKAVELVTKDQLSVEFWAMAVGAMCSDIRDRLASPETREAVLSGLRLGTFWAMLIFLRDLEDHVWTGYRQNQLIYGIAKAAAQTPAEAEAIEALEPTFSRLSEQVLHAWVQADVDIGSRLGVTGVEEPLLRALAQYHLAQFELRRKEQQLRKENRSRTWMTVATSFSAGAVTVTAVVGLLKVLGVL